jgi:predicted metalloprotease with PDZ domain
VCKIRPKELLPYDLSKEILLDSGLILEGVTTYMGDKILLQSNYFSLEDYLKIFKSLMIKEFHHTGWENESIIESSFGLWIDGYKSVIPNKKVSIYSKGALICFCLDILLIQANSSLQELMRSMYKKFGKTLNPYSLNDFKELIICNTQNPEKVNHFFEKYVYGHEDLYPVIVESLQSIGIECVIPNLEPNILNRIGIVIDPSYKITKIHPASEAYHQLMLGDEIIHLNGQPVDQTINSKNNQVAIKIRRWGKLEEQTLPLFEHSFFPDYQLSVVSKNDVIEKWLSI